MAVAQISKTFNLTLTGARSFFWQKLLILIVISPTKPTIEFSLVFYIGRKGVVVVVGGGGVKIRNPFAQQRLCTDGTFCPST